jgi:hypothetical protein
LTLRNALFKSKAQFERKFHKKLRRSFYQSGYFVLVQNTAVEKELNRKTKPQYLGPYEVDRHTRGGSYVLKEMDRTFLHQGVAAFRLYPYIDQNSPILETLANKEESDDSDSDSNSGSDLLADQD